jgi:hypothetical protein
MLVFIGFQPSAAVSKYCDLLSVLGSLSGLFADGEVPYLHYQGT